MKRKMWRGAAAALGLLILIIDTKTALQGAAEGIKLCLRTVIPSLFPFLVLTAVLSESWNGSEFGLFRLAGKLCRMPRGSESAILSGFLGGYPAGAFSVSRLYDRGRISTADAGRMLILSCNAGPAFLFGVAAGRFPWAGAGGMLWLIQIFSAFAAAYLMPGGSEKTVQNSPAPPLSLPEILHRAVSAMGGICGWIVLFGVWIGFLRRWIFWIFPREVQIVFTGMLELTGGICALEEIPALGTRFILCSGLLSFGGLCIWMQVQYAAGSIGMRQYFWGKLLQTFLSISMASLVQLLVFAPEEQAVIPPVWFATDIALLSAMVVILRRKEKRSSISVLSGV